MEIPPDQEAQALAPRPHPTDRRVTLIEATAKAAGMGAQLDEAYRESARLLIGDMPGPDLARVLAVISQIEDRLDEAVPEADAGLPPGAGPPPRPGAMPGPSG